MKQSGPVKAGPKVAAGPTGSPAGPGATLRRTAASVAATEEEEV